MSLRHPFLSLDVPETFESVPPQGTVSYHWTHCLGAELLVTIGLRPASTEWNARAELEAYVVRTLADKAVGTRLVGEPEWLDDGRIVSVTYVLDYFESGQRSMVRIGTTKTPMVPPADLRLAQLVHPMVRIGLYAPLDEIDRFEDIVSSAIIAPRHETVRADARHFATDLDHIFPYVITDRYVEDRDGARVATGKPREGAAGLTPAGGGLWLALVHDYGDGLRVLFPSDVANAKLVWSECMQRAQMNLRARVGSEELPLGVVDVPEPPGLVPSLAPWRGAHLRVEGMPALRMLVVGSSWLAASCLFALDLRAGAEQALGTDRLLALAPHRDRLFVFPDRGDEANAMLVDQILKIESDAPKPLSPSMFRLEPDGPHEVIAS